ncbi:cob(I)yrinic acid a,c-diamide adenosyltransferase [bacterium]|nr:cob(I)yrinic acid a,c-diamide adenosyltransferase [bacterium]PJA73877.1 MAG: ATP:cob(I)alamin adenosyltransferase [bacterium CG_4_9_14_3_um_filter_65_15]
MRIYTRTGDQGQTSLGDGTRLPKSAPRIDLYGDIDELNSVLGCCLSVLPAEQEGTLATLHAALLEIQDQLFALGMVIADPGRCRAGQNQEQASFPVKRLEDLIDGLDRDLPPLKNFILPGGTSASGFLHLARTVCRRCERKAVALAADEPVPASAVIFLNRLSDFLFTAARSANLAARVDDVPWAPNGQDD